MRPIKDLTDAVTMPFRAVFVVGICWFINWMTSPHYWWVWWVALGMGIATLVAWAKGLRTAAVLLLAFFVGRWIYRRYGEQARAAFDFALPWQTLAWAVLGVALIGLTNLTVSFALALWMALRARGITRAPVGEMLRRLWLRFRQAPASFFTSSGLP